MPRKPFLVRFAAKWYNMSVERTYAPSVQKTKRKKEIPKNKEKK